MAIGNKVNKLKVLKDIKKSDRDVAAKENKITRGAVDNIIYKLRKEGSIGAMELLKKDGATADEIAELMEVLGEEVTEKEIKKVFGGEKVSKEIKKEKVVEVKEDKKVEQKAQQEVKTVSSEDAKEKYMPKLKPTMLDGEYFSYHLSSEGVKFYEVNSKEEFISKKIILEQVEALKIWENYYGAN